MIVTLNTTDIQAQAILYAYSSGGNCFVVLEYLTGLPINELPLQITQTYDSLKAALGGLFIEVMHASFGNILVNASRVKSISGVGLITFDNSRSVTTSTDVNTFKTAVEQASPAARSEASGGLTKAEIKRINFLMP